MWNYDEITKKWSKITDDVKKTDFDLLKRDFSETRLYSRFLSGATYLQVTDFNDIYDIWNYSKPKNLYVSNLGSQYSDTVVPTSLSTPINKNNYKDIYNKFLREYSFTLKNTFTPKNLIDESLKNFFDVDVCSTVSVDLTLIDKNMTIDGVKLINGHRVLIKDQTTTEAIQNTIEPNSYFISNYKIGSILGATIEYTYYNNENGIYIYDNGQLIRDNKLFEEYENSIKYGVYVKLGNINKDKQFNLSRLLSGYFPTEGQPIEFLEKHNWIQRNRVDYNNLFEINYYDTFKHDSSIYIYDSVTYSIPSRIISIGEFGVILNTQYDTSNIINNKYKENLRSISDTSIYYFVCGDNGTLFKVRKHDFEITPIKVTESNLYSVDFFDDYNGIIVGDLNTIYITSDGGLKWDRIHIKDFEPYIYKIVKYYTRDKIYIGGNIGTFIELSRIDNKWEVYKRRISKLIDSEEEHILVEDIRDFKINKFTNLQLEYTYNTNVIPVDGEFLIMTTNNSNIILFDINSITDFKYLYLDLQGDYKNINNLIINNTTNSLYFTNDDSMYFIDLSSVLSIGVDNEYSNSISISSIIDTNMDIMVNKIYNSSDDEIILAGNNSYLKSYDYTNFNDIDPSFESKLHSKLLILDYDMASKVNFFEDNGTYRKPNPIIISSTDINNSTLISFDNIDRFYGNTQSGFTQSETNWLNYWKDSLKTFEYYSATNSVTSPIVEFSTDFRFTTSNTDLNITSISNELSIIENLAPNISDKSKGRYLQGLTQISEPTDIYDLYIYDYLMVIRVPNSYDVQVSDVLYIVTNDIKTDLLVNKIVQFSTHKYIYLYTEFDENITNYLVSNQTMLVFNLNTFNDNYNLLDKLSSHPLSICYYSYIDDNSDLVIDTKFNNFTAYYNTATRINVDSVNYDMEYTNGLLDFGYTPTYNILDYLKSISDKFEYNKEYLLMPIYKNIPFGALTSSVVYTDTNGYNKNRLKFGSDFELEYESLMINTFVDVIIHGTTDYSTEKLLILNKYYNKADKTYVIEFHKEMNYLNGDTNILNGGTIDILSRRTLKQISDDLIELNNIQRGYYKTRNVYSQNVGNLLEYTNYQSELNHKFNTDSYAKILLSDSDTYNSLTGIIYTDYENRLSVNIITLGSDYSIDIESTYPYNSNELFIKCSDTSNLRPNDGVILKYDGIDSVDINYLGYQVVDVVSSIGFTIKGITFSNLPSIESSINFSKRDSFFNFEPIDLIDYNTNKQIDISIELNHSNFVITDNKYKLINVDLSKYRFKLVDGLTLSEIMIKYQWLLEAEIRDAIIGKDENGIVWYKGIWDSGRWFGGTWKSGTWKSGDWYGGLWQSKIINYTVEGIKVDDKTRDYTKSLWYGGRWYDGTWEDGVWYNGRWYDGSHNNGYWFRGIWNDGTWNDGTFSGGVWVLGTWNKGNFNCNVESCFWVDGKFNGGDFENGIWYNGLFEQKNTLARFGTKSFNTRPSIWNGGKFISGSFHSRLFLNNDGTFAPSEDNRLSIWKTGLFMNGNFYGGVSYQMDLKSGTWHSGILDEIQIIGVAQSGLQQYITLNGVFRFNIADSITIINIETKEYETYKVINVILDEVNKYTTLELNSNLSVSTLPNNTVYRLVSKLENLNWKSGIFTNGVYESGLYEGGLFYDGVFKGTWG